jgi:arylsulfatase A-like enzyme
MSKKTCWWLFALYLAIIGSFCGLEIDTFLGDTPFFQLGTLITFINALCIVLVPPILYALFASARRLWEKRIIRIFILILNAVFFHLAAFLLVYKSVRRLDFDFYFFWYNTADALPALWKLYAPWFPIVVLFIIGFVFMQKPAFSPIMDGLRRSKKIGFLLAAIFTVSALCQLATIRTVRNSTAGFLYASFFSDRQLRNDYGNLYRKHITDLRSDAPATGGQADPSIMGDVIFFIKQESLNALLAGTKITPQLMRASQDGILFPKIYANSIQSLRGYECILCGVPPSIAGALVDDYPAGELKDLSCLPKVFKSLGYHPLYFFGGSRNPRIVQFAETIGFEKVLADDIMKEGDTKFDWGYREDVFFTRVFEYLQQHYVNGKLFIFIDTGATNHDPFEVLDKVLLDKIPFPKHENFIEHLSNTTFVQDAYFGHFYGLFKKHYADRGAVVAVSDHSWPMEEHKYNIYNERGAYEENFLIPLLFVPPRSKKESFAIGTTVDYRFSQMDIFPTVLDLIGMKQKHLLGESVAPWLMSSPNRERLAPVKTEISIQPYGGGFISAVRYPEKYLFDVLGRNVKIYDLQKDPQEHSPEIHDVGEYMPLIKDFFNP